MANATQICAEITAGLTLILAENSDKKHSYSLESLTPGTEVTG